MTTTQTPGPGVADIHRGPAQEARPDPAPKVVGIDPSLTATGIAYRDGWCTKVGKAGITTLPLAARIEEIDRLIDDILDHLGHPVDLVVIETPSLKSTSGGAVERHALWWLLVRRLVRRGQALAAVTPSQRVMYATGKGNASKSAVVDAVARRLPMFETGGDDNLCDAAVLCAMGCDHLGSPLAVVPATHRRALDKVTWPEAVTW